MERLNTIRTIYEQQKYMYDNRTHSVPDRIISVSPPFVRPIVRKKQKASGVWREAGHQCCGWVDTIGMLIL